MRRFTLAPFVRAHSSDEAVRDMAAASNASVIICASHSMWVLLPAERWSRPVCPVNVAQSHVMYHCAAPCPPVSWLSRAELESAGVPCRAEPESSGVPSRAEPVLAGVHMYIPRYT